MAKNASSLPDVAGALGRIGACEEAIEWSRQFGNDWARAWRECGRTEWLWWFAVDQVEPTTIAGKQLVAADKAGIAAAREAPDHNADSWDETGGPKSCAAYRKHVKWGKHIKPVLREMGWL